MMTLLIQLISFIERSGMLRLFGVRAARVLGFQLSTWSHKPISEKECVWFHASSLGELEMLRPLIEDFHQRGLVFGVSAFSDSALKGLDFLKPIAVYAGLSPPESEWFALFNHFKVNKLILAKYDLWPGLLSAAQVRDLPVIIINAQNRRSLKIMSLVFSICLRPFPRLFLFANQKSIADSLFRDFGKKAEVMLAPDPRWERVARRKENAIFDVQLRGLLDQITHLPGTIGIVGSAWMSDLEVLLPALKNTTDSLVVVPHDLSPQNLAEMQALLLASLAPSRVLLVDQMGLLAELYQTADWVWVGGGFGHGIHSLIEPAFHAIPIACGPKHFEDFPEAIELKESGILTRCMTEADAKAWIDGPAHQVLERSEMWQKRSGYRALLEECVGIQ